MVYSSYEEVIEAVETIKTLMQETGEIPSVLLSAYKESLMYMKGSLRERFYAELVKRCPQALKYFT